MTVLFLRTVMGCEAQATSPAPQPVPAYHCGLSLRVLIRVEPENFEMFGESAAAAGPDGDFRSRP